MLKIRNSQFEIFRKKKEEEFVQRMTYELKRDFSTELKDHGIKDDKVEALVRGGIDQARKYNVTGKSDLEFYLQCLLLLNPNFADGIDYPQIKKILENNDLTGDEKMVGINDYMIFDIDVPR